MQQSTDNKITIIVTTYKSSQTIYDFLRSVYKAKNRGIVKEIIIIENNSPDKNSTKKIISSWKKFLNIKYINSGSNIGFAKSSNLGAKSASTDYLLFLNPDTELNDESIASIFNHAVLENADIIGGISKSHEGIAHRTAVRKPTMLVALLEFSNLRKIFKTVKGERYFYYGDLEDNIYLSKKDIVVDAVSGSFLMIKKTVFEELRGFDENFFMYLEDVDLGVRANLLGKRVLFCPHSTIKHIGGASSKSKYRIHHQAWFNSRKYYFRKHFNNFENMIIQPIYIFEEYILKRIRNI